MAKLPFIALKRGYTRAETLTLVLSELGRTDDRLAPYHTTHGWGHPGPRTVAARRTARRFINAQICAHERALEAMQ